MELRPSHARRPPPGGFVLTGKPEVIGSSVALVPTNALVLTGLATFWVVG